jgi:hypothetical protein
MILLLSVSPFGQAGAKRLHPTLRRIRQHELRSGSFASLNKKDFNLYLVFTAPPFSKRRRLRTPGLKSEPMYNREKFNPRRLLASQRGSCTFSVAQSFPQSLCPELQSREAVFLSGKQASEKPEGHRELFTRSRRNSMYFTVSLGTAPDTEAFDKRPIALVCPLHKPCFSRVAPQPQQPVVQALKKILRSA